MTLPAVAILAGCGDGAGGDAGASARPHIASASCPLKTPAEWQSFLEVTASDENWVKTCNGEGDCKDAEARFSEQVQSEVLGLFERCARDLSDNPRIVSCTERLRRFAFAWLEQHAGYSYGFRHDNRSYLAAQTAADVPSGMMDPPSELLAALPARTTIEATASSQGWPSLTHDSLLGGVRTFITVADPGGSFDQWLLVNLDASAASVKSPSVMSFIGVQKKDASGVDLPHVRLHFRDYWLEEVDGAWQLSLPEDHEGKCYSCHASGLRLLSPSGDGVAAFNERLLAYGLPDWNGTIDPADHGPPLGDGLGCTACHDGVTRGVLTVSTSEQTLKQKVVDQLSMQALRPNQPVPDEAAMQLLERERTGNPALSAVERTELEAARARHQADFQSFSADRFPAWRAWALEQSCQ